LAFFIFLEFFILLFTLVELLFTLNLTYCFIIGNLPYFQFDFKTSLFI
jgi:hypothetical protein